MASTNERTPRGPSRAARRRSRRFASTEKRVKVPGIGIAAAVLVVGLAAVILAMVPRGQNRPLEPRPPDAAASTAPINSVDPLTRLLVEDGITSTWKGYTIGHSSEESRQEFESFDPRQKDAIVRRLLR